MTATEEIAEQCDASSGLPKGAVPIAVWVLVIQFAAQLLSTCYADSEFAAQALRERRLKRNRVVRRLRRRTKRQLKDRSVPEEYWNRMFETVYDQSVRLATSGLMSAVWHDSLQTTAA